MILLPILIAAVLLTCLVLHYSLADLAQFLIRFCFIIPIVGALDVLLLHFFCFRGILENLPETLKIDHLFGIVFVILQDISLEAHSTHCDLGVVVARFTAILMRFN